jgi:hypothetical protein
MESQMKLWTFIKENIMPRPKGSKNKPKTDQPVEFDYEKFGDDSAYASLMTTPHQNQPMQEEPWTMTENITTQMDAVRAPPVRNTNEQNIFLIEGRVRLDQLGAEEPIVSDQKRIVIARDFDDAVSKFVTYFRGLSNNNQRYNVVSVGGSEAIK